MKRTMFYNDGGQSTLRRAGRASPPTRAERASLFSSGGEVEGRWKQAAEAIGGRTTVDAVLSPNIGKKFYIRPGVQFEISRNFFLYAKPGKRTSPVRRTIENLR